MRTVEVDINYMSVEAAIEVLQEFVGQNASISLDMEQVPYENRERIAVNIEIPESKQA